MRSFLFLIIPGGHEEAGAEMGAVTEGDGAPDRFGELDLEAVSHVRTSSFFVIFALSAELDASDPVTGEVFVKHAFSFVMFV